MISPYSYDFHSAFMYSFKCASFMHILSCQAPEISQEPNGGGQGHDDGEFIGWFLQLSGWQFAQDRCVM